MEEGHALFPPEIQEGIETGVLDGSGEAILSTPSVPVVVIVVDGAEDII